jgi:hypothetical protein
MDKVQKPNSSYYTPLSEPFRICFFIFIFIFLFKFWIPATKQMGHRRSKFSIFTVPCSLQLKFEWKGGGVKNYTFVLFWNDELCRYCISLAMHAYKVEVTVWTLEHWTFKIPHHWAGIRFRVEIITWFAIISQQVRNCQVSAMDPKTDVRAARCALVMPVITVSCCDHLR